MVRPLRIAALVKQIPAFDEMRLGPDGRLARAGLPLEMSAYCRRAVAEGVALASATGGTCTVMTMGPPSAEDVLREAVAFGADAGVHLTDAAFAGSDTLATARALAALLEREGPFDLVLVGRNSVDADTGQVGPQVAQLLDLPFATGVKELALAGDGATVAVGLELDDEWVAATVDLPAVLSTAERLIDPCKIKDPSVWAGVDAARLRRVDAATLGPGPWGQQGSPTRVGETRTEEVVRDRRVLDGSVEDQVATAVAMLLDRGALGAGGPASAEAAPGEIVPTTGGAGPVVAVVAEPGRPRHTRELLGGAARLAAEQGGRVLVIGSDLAEAAHLGAWGADEVLRCAPAAGSDASALVEEDIATVVAEWIEEVRPWAVLTGSTAWGREVAARAAAATGSGLTGDAVGLAVQGGRLVAWKPAFGGSLVAAITASSPTQMATVRSGVLATRAPRAVAPITEKTVEVKPRGRVRVTSRRREDDIDALASAAIVIGIGQAIQPDEYPALDELRALLGAEVAATRKVTDRGWMPHARQIGITGHTISPPLFVSLASSGKYNHAVGFASAGTVLAVNTDPQAPVFGYADIGIVADWHEVVPALARRISAALGRPTGGTS